MICFFPFLHCFCICFPVPFAVSILLFSIPPINTLVVSQNHLAGCSLPPHLPTTNRALHLDRQKISALSSVVDQHRVTPTHRRGCAYPP